MPTFKLKLNSVEKTEALLQEIYDDIQRQKNFLNNQISELKESTKLSDEPLEQKTKFAKAMNDFAVTVDKSIGRKMEVSKIMAEILKYSGNIEKVLGEDEIFSKLDLGAEMRKVREQVIDTSSINKDPEIEKYITNTKKRT